MDQWTNQSLQISSGKPSTERYEPPASAASRLLGVPTPGTVVVTARTFHGSLAMTVSSSSCSRRLTFDDVLLELDIMELWQHAAKENAKQSSTKSTSASKGSKNLQHVYLAYMYHIQYIHM